MLPSLRVSINSLLNSREWDSSFFSMALTSSGKSLSLRRSSILLMSNSSPPKANTSTSILPSSFIQLYFFAFHEVLQYPPPPVHILIENEKMSTPIEKTKKVFAAL